MMGRLSILDLPLPATPYQPQIVPRCKRTGQRFENFIEIIREDWHRSSLIRRACESEVPFNREEALALADRLGDDVDELAAQRTMASKISMACIRICVGGALWKLVDIDSEPANTFTVLLPNGVINVHDLLEFNPVARMKSLRSALNRLGATGANGYLFACIHGEFDPTTNRYHLHVHGVASGEMLQIVDRLRELPGYRTRKGEKQKVRVGRKPLTNLPYPLTYIIQSSWPCRWNGQIDGEHRRGTIRHRIPEPYHTALLLWLDRWSFQDITLMMGMRVGREGFILNK